MEKKIIAIILTVSIILATVNTNTIKASAVAYYPTGGVEMWAATKIIDTLYNLGGVAFDSLSQRTIWEGGKLNVNQLLANYAEYSQTLVHGMLDLINAYTSGQTKLIVNRAWWYEWKKYLRDTYGTETSTSTNLGTTSVQITPIGAGVPIDVSYDFGGYRGTTQYVFTKSVYMITVAQSYANDQPNHFLNVGFFTMDKLTQNEAQQLLDTATIIHGSSNTTSPEPSVTQSYNNDIGYYLMFRIGTNAGTFTFPVTFDAGVPYINLGSVYLGDTPTNYWNLITAKIANVRSAGGAYDETTVTARPMQGVGNIAATVIGQDILGVGNTATQEGEDVVIGGDIPITIPADVVLEDVLRRIAEGTATYEELIEAVGAVAVDTEDTTEEEVEEKEKELVIPAPTLSYTVSIKDLFPFCIPFDLYNMIQALQATPVAPSVTITLPVSYNGNTFTWEEYEISLADFDLVAQVVRVFEYIIFCIGLMLITRKLIEG